MLDLERAQILSYTVLFNRMNEESGQVNYLLMPTVHSNFIVISTSAAHTYLNSLSVFCSKEKAYHLNFHLKIKHLIKYCISSTWLLSQIFFFAVNNKAPRRFNSNIIFVNLKFIHLQVSDRYYYISLDPEVLWVISAFKKKSQTTILSTSWVFLKLLFIGEKNNWFWLFQEYTF